MVFDFLLILVLFDMLLDFVVLWSRLIHDLVTLISKGENLTLVIS